MTCETKCIQTRMRDRSGKIVVKAQAGNKRFDAGVCHAMCDECLKGELEAMKRKAREVEPTHSLSAKDAELFKKFDELKRKFRTEGILLF